MSQSKARYIERLRKMVKDDKLFHHEIAPSNLKVCFDKEIENEQIEYERAQFVKPELHKDWFLGEKIEMDVQGKLQKYGWLYDVFNEIHFVIFKDANSLNYKFIEDDEVPLKVACEFVQKYRTF